jgi:crotonobetainyl-CoA:carnitine CoA-transferase CaiB-like acyl-CoA transferase
MAGTGALDGIKVLEFSEMIAAPFAGMHLGDMGADVIKVEPTAGEAWRLTAQFAPNESRVFMALNRNKRDLALDLKSAAGREVVARLVPAMDVVLVNYRPDALVKLGIDYETLRRLNERIIYVDNTAMGSRGEECYRPGYDLIAQAVTGLMVTGARRDADDLPLPLTPAIADYGTGLAMAMAVCAALFARERTGVGQKVETTLLGTSLALQGSGFLRTGMVTTTEVDRFETELTADQRRALGAYYRVYRTADSMIAIACLTPVLRRKLAEVVGVEDARHTRKLGRLSAEAVTIAEEFTAAVTECMLERTTGEWLALLDAAGVPAGAVRHVKELADDPQVLANDLVVDFEHPVTKSVAMVGPIVRMSATPTRAQSPPPTLGQHSDEILAELGYSNAEIASLREHAVVA